jgi:3-oxoadipate enol-lactonase
MKFATVGGITLHYTLEGLKEGTSLVFINSLGSDFRIWDKLVPDFAEYFSIIRYDKRGHGLSDCPPGPYSIRDHVSDLTGLLGHLKVKQAILIGISVGGMIALYQTFSNSQSIRALVLCDTAAKIGTAEFWDERIATIRKNGLEDMAGTILGRWFAPAFSDQHPAEYQGYYNMLTRTPVAGYIATCEAIRDADLNELVGTITAKTLVLCGVEDLVTPPDLGRQLAETMIDARFESIKKAAHLPCVEQPEAMAQKIDRFLRENGYV